MSERLLLGVDGGNSKTIALLARADGTIVGAGRAGACDHYASPTPAAAYDEVAGRDRGRPRRGRRRHVADRAAPCSASPAPTGPRTSRSTRARSPRAPGLTIEITVVNDAIGGLRGGTSDGVGVAIVCGTGTAVGARAADGRLWNTSFWAEPSYRYSMSRGAIEAAARAEVGIDEPTLLQQLVPASTGHASVEELLRAMTMLGAQRPPLGLPAIALLDAADRGDATALRVLGEVADAMVEMAIVSARHAGLRDGVADRAGGRALPPSERPARARARRARCPGPRS